MALDALGRDVDNQVGADAAREPVADFSGLQAATAAFRAAALRLQALQGGAAGDAADRLLMSVRHELMPWLYADDGEFVQALRTRAYAVRYEVLGAAARAAAAGDRAAAGKALEAIYEGRQCQRLSPAVYGFERAYWAGEGGWATRFGQRAPPPAPAVEHGCQALVDPGGDLASASRLLLQGQAEAQSATQQSIALMTAKLRQATARLADFPLQGQKGEN